MSREALDELRSDMAAHQRERARVDVTDQANHRLAADLLERIDRENADSKAPPSAPVRDFAVDAVDVGPDPLIRKANPQEHWFLVRAKPRIEMLLTKMETGPMGQPSWRQRTLAAMYFQERATKADLAGRSDLADNYRRQAFADMMDLLEASSAVFGDWRKDPAA